MGPVHVRGCSLGLGMFLQVSVHVLELGGELGLRWDVLRALCIIGLRDLVQEGQ